MNSEAFKKSFTTAYISAFIALLPAVLIVAHVFSLKPGAKLMMFAMLFFTFTLFFFWIIAYRIKVLKMRRKAHNK